MDYHRWRQRLRHAVHSHDGDEIVLVLRESTPPECLQLAGEAVKVAIACGAAGAGPVAAQCAAGLGDRKAQGDEELAVELTAAANQTEIPNLIATAVDLEELGDALCGSMGDVPGILEVGSGRFWPPLEIAPDDIDDDAPEPDGVRVIEVWPEGPGDAYRDMSDFIATIEHDGIARQLEHAIHGKGAFRRFRDTLDRWPDEMSRWQSFSDDRRIGRARAWLADAGLTPTRPPESDA